MPNKYERNYKRIEKLFQRTLKDLEVGDHFKLYAKGFMDLSVEVLPDCHETGAKIVSMCHYFERNGDLCQDPEVVVRLFPPGSTAFLQLCPSTDPKLGRAEGVEFQQAWPPVYHRIYPKPGQYYPKLRTSLNSFLGDWLGNMKAQGHAPRDTEPKENQPD